MRTQDEIEKEMAPLQKRLARLRDELQARIEADRDADLTKMFPDGKIHLRGVMDIAWDRLSGDWYKRVRDFIDAECFKTGGSLRGVYVSGYNPETNQVAVKVMLNQNEPLADQMGIKTVLPLIQPHEGWKTVGIFEHTLSESAVWYLMVSEDDSRFVVLNHRSRPHLIEGRDLKRLHSSDVAEFKDADSALAYIYKTHPYQLLSDED